MRLVLSVALFCATAAGAEPMWEISDRWTCALERHLRAVPGQAVANMSTGDGSYEIDFVAGTVTSAFVPDVAKLIHRAYYPSDFGAHNLLVAEWDSGQYPFVVLEESGSFWEITGSGAGEADGEALIAMYRCLPSR